MSEIGTIRSPSSLDPYRVRYPLKRRRLTVLHAVRVTPSLVRITLVGDDLAGFESQGFDDHVKVFFARPGEAEPSLPEQGPNGPVFAEGAERPIARDFTPRRHDLRTNQLDLEFALHEAGPATEWASRAKAGDILHIGGPRGSTVVPDAYDWYLLVGDETALPAIARRLEELRPSARATVIVEVGGKADELPLSHRAAADISWVHRGAVAAGLSDGLDAAVAAFVPPAGEGFSWIACESDTAKRLRRILVETKGLSKQRIKASGYWKRGGVGHHDTHED